ncbi:MAG: type II toxin-antitoxin system prevent-host-death family antitoxin [Actinobacteria bacterium]|nr:type II toxin-antitoxin system prevent-host-death family antitoxin [Actinomycetota bacterium]
MPKTPQSSEAVQVGIRELRDHLSHWIDVARSGRSVLVTDRGRPVARLVAVDEIPPGLQRLIAEGRAQLPRMPKEPANARPPIKARGSVSEFVREERR